MQIVGLNSIRLPVGWWYFEKLSKVSAHDYLLPKEDIKSKDHPITKIIRYASNAGLKVIIDIKPVEDVGIGHDTIAEITIETAKAVAEYVDFISKEYHLSNVIVVEVGSKMADKFKELVMLNKAIAGIIKINPSLPIMVSDLTALSTANSDSFITLASKVYHGFSVQDIASDSAKADREKMYAHEKIACGFKAPLHFTTCTRAPVLVGEFSLATENCMSGVDPDFANYGQCDRITERFSSPWWQRHTKSFAARQISTYERELGWAFWTYKLDDTAETQDPSAVFWSFRLAVKAGYVDPTSTTDGCLHKPEEDYSWGDGQKPDWAYNSAAPASIAAMTVTNASRTAASSFLLIVAVAGLVFAVVKARLATSRSSYEQVPLVVHSQPAFGVQMSAVAQQQA